MFSDEEISVFLDDQLLRRVAGPSRSFREDIFIPVVESKRTDFDESVGTP